MPVARIVMNSSSIVCHIFKNTIRRFLPLRFLLNPEVYLEPRQLSMMAYFAKNNKRLRAGNYFHKMFRYRYLTCSWYCENIISFKKKKDIIQDLLKDTKKYNGTNHFLILSNELFPRQIHRNAFRCGGFGTGIYMNPLFRDVLNMELFSDFVFIFPISSAKVHNITLLSIKNLKKQ